jgi:hypothetical protein
VAAYYLLTRAIPFSLRCYYAITLLAVLTGCGAGGNDVGTPTAINTRPVTQTDLEIAQLLYVDNRRIPQGFYQETAPTVQGYVTTSHLKNTDVAAATSQYELCTDDWNTALAWSEQAATGTQASNLMETNATARYYEFGRVRAGTPQGYIRARIYRCSYLDRNTVDLRNLNNVAGSFNQRPLNIAELQQLAEYLWQFTPYNNYGNAVLKSSGTTTSSSLQHTLIIASLATTTNSTCDRVSVVGWTHDANAQTGALALTTQTLWEFGARRNAGIVEMCNPN